MSHWQRKDYWKKIVLLASRIIDHSINYNQVKIHNMEFFVLWCPLTSLGKSSLPKCHLCHHDHHHHRHICNPTRTHLSQKHNKNPTSPVLKLKGNTWEVLKLNTLEVTKDTPKERLFPFREILLKFWRLSSVKNWLWVF